MRPISEASRFLTILPLPGRATEPWQYAVSAWFFSAIGLLIGLIQVGVIKGVQGMGIGATPTVALLAICVGAMVTGTRHLVQFGGSIDRVFGEGASVSRGVLGPGGVMVVFAILLKWQFYEAAIGFMPDFYFPIAVCCISRWSIVLAGWGAKVAEDEAHADRIEGLRWHSVMICGLLPVGIAIRWYGLVSIPLIVLAILIPLGVRLCYRLRKADLTVEALGATNELVEIVALTIILYEPIVRPFLPG